MTIEDIILSHDRRGVSALKGHLPDNFCDEAACMIIEHPGTAVIVTGFYIMAAGATETDGPPGAVAIGNALRSIGYNIVYVTDRYTAPVMSSMTEQASEVIEFPVTDDYASRSFATDLLSQLTPSVLIAIERCGLTDENIYRNMHGADISEFNARIDELFNQHPHTVGIGDGGNEIGMGNLASVIKSVPSLVKKPTITSTSKLIISSVSNWGGYGLVAALSKQSQQNLLPSVEFEKELLRSCVDAGAVDGMSTKQEYKVDGFTMEENSKIVAELHAFLARQGLG